MKRRLRNEKGMGAIELGVTAFVAVIFVCVAIDMSIMMMGNELLDRATRDAARAAAGQSDAVNAKLAAVAALKNHKADGFYVSQPTLSNADFVYQDNGGTPQGQIIPSGSPNAGTKAGPSYVQLAATVQVSLPASLSCLQGLGLFQGPMASGKMDFKRNYYFPIIKAKLNNAFQ